MKNKLILLIISICLPCIVNASEYSLSLSCPDTATAGDVISCSISARTSDLSGISAKYSLSSGLTYNSFNLENASAFNINVCNSNGFSLGNTSGLVNNFKVGVLNLKLSSTASVNEEYKVSLVELDGSDMEFNSVTGNTVTETIRIKSDNNNLKDLKVKTGQGYLDLGFSENKLNYTINVDNSVVVITGDVADKNAKVTGLGLKSLNYGTNEFKIIVTSEMGTKKTYTINIILKDLRSTNNNLKSLLVSNTNISFNNSDNYKETVNSNIEKIKIEAIAEDNKAKIEGIGEKKLNYGTNKFNIIVIAENGDKKTYTIEITRKDDRNSDNSLKSLKVGNIDVKLGLSNFYTITVDPNKENIELVATANSSVATIKGLGKKQLKYGINSFEITVTAENKKERVYTLNINRINDTSDNTLKSLSVSNTDIVFDGKENYTTVVKNNISSVNIDAIANSAKAEVIGTGYHELKVGENKILIKVISFNKEEKIYTINITRNEEKINETIDSNDSNRTDNSNNIIKIVCIIVILISLFTIVAVVIILNNKKKRNLF